MNFVDLGLSPATIRAIEEFGISEPTTVQSDVIPSILEGKDVFTIAPQGCGKTMSYVFPLVDIISTKGAQNILIITPNSEQSVVTSDRMAIFNKYHEINEATIKDAEEDIDDEANVIIGSPELLLDIVEHGKIDLSKTNILVVDDINLIKKNKQLENLGKILDLLPSEKQNIVYTNRRSRETQEVLEKILKAPEEIKVDKDKEQEAEISAQASEKNTPNRNQNPIPNQNPNPNQNRNRNRNDRNKNNNNRRDNGNIAPRAIPATADPHSVEMAKQHNSFNGRAPSFILTKGILVDNEVTRNAGRDTENSQDADSE